MATIIVSADKVIQAANEVIARIENKQKEDNERIIAYTIQNSMPGNLGRLFGRRTLTKEQAIKALSADLWGDYPSIRGAHIKHCAEKLLKLAQHGDPVTLNQEDCDILF